MRRGRIWRGGGYFELEDHINGLELPYEWLER